MPDIDMVLYWDASAVLSLVFEDAHSAMAVAAMRADRMHLVSSLTWAETQAVIDRMRRTKAVPEAWIAVAHDKLSRQPWRRVSAVPDWALSRELAARWPLRGADLWHLALAKTLQHDLKELMMVTYNAALVEAALGEGLLDGGAA